jgi:N-acetylglucosamine malate deacetylase 2
VAIPSELKPRTTGAALDGAALLSQLARGGPIAAPAVAVSAHPDDETLGFGSRLPLFEDLELVHLTPGAPRDDGDARRAGFADARSYAAARAGELDAALAALGAAPRRRQLGYTDQDVVFHLTALTDQLAKLLDGAALVLTHTYEGGHPDHDAAAFAVQAACRRLRALGRPAPVRIEFAGYHLRRGERVTGTFWPDPGRPEMPVRLEGDALARKTAALAAHRSQAAVIGWFDGSREAYRLAPDYDFAAPPPPGEALYDGWGWSLTSALWRGQARAAADWRGVGERAA